jgi:hypothetical protein
MDMSNTYVLLGRRGLVKWYDQGIEPVRSETFPVVAPGPHPHNQHFTRIIG